MSEGRSKQQRPSTVSALPSTKPWATMWFFCGLLSVLFLCKFASGSYLYAMLTTIEKAFGLSATEIAGLKSMGGATYSVMMVFVMILAKKVHVPRTMAMASVGIGLAFFIQLIPYLYGEGRGSMGLRNNHEDDGKNKSVLEQVDLRRPLCFSPTLQMAIDEEQCQGDSSDGARGPPKSDGSNKEYFFLAAGKIIAMGLGPFVVILYSPYIDNNVPQQKAALYISVVKSLQFTGPIIGMGLGSYLSQVPVELKPVNISPKDPQFVGAWWIGILIFGPLLLISAMPLFFFPRKPYMSEEDRLVMEKMESPEGETFLVIKEDDQDKENGDLFVVVKDEKAPAEEEEDAKREPVGGLIGLLKALWLHMKDFFNDVCQIFTNKMWISCFIGDLVSGFGWGGMFTFLPKTLELQYSFASWQASIILGIVIGIGAGSGMIVSGVVVRKMKLKPPGMALHVIIVRALYVCCLIIMMFLTSNGANIDGKIDPGSGLKVLNVSCNANCNCGQEAFYPICGEDGKNYFSPCHAGCKNMFQQLDKKYVFTDCSCIGEGNHTAHQGYCQLKTNTKGFIYVTVLFFWLFIACTNTMSQILFKFRAIKPEQKALSVGVSSLTRSLIGAVISNMIYGRFIDSSCLIWREKCGTRKNCYFYDMYKYHLLIHGGCALFSFLSTLCYAVGYYFAKQRNWDHLDVKTEEKPKTVPDKNNNNNNKSLLGKIKMLTSNA